MITAADLRDKYGRLKRQAARFRIFAYPASARRSYPTGAGNEVRIGSVLGGKTVTDVVWTVHLANKKANSYVLSDDLGIHVFEQAHAADLELRNADEGPDPDNSARLKKLVIDPGPRAISGQRRRTGAVRQGHPRLLLRRHQDRHHQRLPQNISRGQLRRRCIPRWATSTVSANYVPTNMAGCWSCPVTGRRAAGCSRTVRRFHYSAMPCGPVFTVMSTPTAGSTTPATGRCRLPWCSTMAASCRPTTAG